MSAERAETDGLSLYQFAGCFFCTQVWELLAELDLQIEQRDVRADPARYRELCEATGRGTVPCLRIEHADGTVEWLHESLDIIDYLRERFAA